MRTLASIGEAVPDVELPQALRPQTMASAGIRIAARMDGYYSSQGGDGNGGNAILRGTPKKNPLAAKTGERGEVIRS